MEDRKDLMLGLIFVFGLILGGRSGCLEWF